MLKDVVEFVNFWQPGGGSLPSVVCWAYNFYGGELMSAGNTKNWFALEAREALRGLDSSEQGLANAEAAKRLAQ